MSDIQYIAEEMRQLRSDNEDLRRRLASVIMTGQVKESAGDKTRLVFDEKDASTGEPFEGPMIRRASSSGAKGQGLRERSKPQVGETMIMISPNGEIGKHSRLIPAGPTDESAEPDHAPDAPWCKQIGDVSISMAGGGLTFKAGGVSVVISAAGLSVTGGALKHDGKNFGKDHIHGGIEPGGSNTDVPAN